MATISKDNGSDWRAGGVRRRDFRHVKDGPEESPRGPNRRKRRLLARWCRGKVGQEHTYNDAAAQSLGRPPYLIAWNDCSRCGKRLYRRDTWGVVRPDGPTRVDLTGTVWEIREVPRG